MDTPTTNKKDELSDFRNVQTILDKAVKQHLELITISQKAEIKALYNLVFETNNNVKKTNENLKILDDKVEPIVAAWGDGKIVGKVLWLVLKGTLWFSLFIGAIAGAWEILRRVVKQWII